MKKKEKSALASKRKEVNLPPDLYRLGTNMLANRIRLRLTIPQAAEQIGMHQSTYFRMEDNGTDRAKAEAGKLPDFGIMIRICNWLGHTVQNYLQ